MTDHTFIIQAIAQGGWEAFQAAGATMLRNFFGFLCEMGMVVSVFVLLIGVIYHFSHYSPTGKQYIVNAIAAFIIISVFYMAILGTAGPPDISIWFRPPE
jgi:hypothetical protein